MGGILPFSSGSFSLAAGNPVVTGTTISSTVQNNTMSDVATGLSTCVLKDGSQTITANIPMAGFKFTGLGAGTSANDSVRLTQAQGAAYLTATSVAGTNTITGTLTPAITAYAAGQFVYFVPANTNTGATTAQWGGVGSAQSVFWNGAACVGGELRQNIPALLYHDGTQFHIVGNGFNAPFLDTHAVVEGSADSTKKLRFEVDGLTTATTRVVTMPDTDINLVYSQQATTSLAGAGEWAVQSEMDAGTASKVATTDLNKISLGTEQATTSGTAKDFTGIPAGVRRITVHFAGVSTNGTSNIIIQLGDSGGIENTNYIGGANNSSGGTVAANSAGFVVMVGVVAAKDASGHVTLVLEDSSDFTWTQTGLLVSSDALAATLSAGYKSLSAELTQLRITTASGDTFDAGAVNISYER